MPCYDPPLSKEERYKYGYYNEEDLSAMLCLAMRRGVNLHRNVVLDNDEDELLRNRLIDWWDMHQKLDQSRKRK